MSFAAAKVLAFESRRANEMAELIRINGGEPFVAPALMEVPLEQNQAAFDFAARLYAGDFDMIIFLTGVGTRFLHRVLATRDPEDRFPEALRRLTVVARGPKPTAVLREWQVPIAVSVPEPNTWRELLDAVRTRPEMRVAVQEYGRPNPELLAGLEAQGRKVTAVPVYQWQLPQDAAPLTGALQVLLDGGFDAALFTTGVQIEHFLAFAGRHGQGDQARTALGKLFIGSIGPDCTESLKTCGLTPAMEPSHPKMGMLVREAALKFAEARQQRA
ncbi:MAG: uroporphyrinogen-III synthase [Acidobacteriaceae bacterium]|nr:uroporphyrinogen-III synthase [Acidobacteriaceae bacterium]